MSISHVAKAGCAVVFAGDFCRILNANKEQIGEIRERKGLYRVFTINSGEEASAVGTRDALSINELHRR